MIAIICIELEYLFQNTKMYFWFYLWPLYHYIIYIKQIISSCTLPGTWMAKSFYILCTLKCCTCKITPNSALWQFYPCPVLSTVRWKDWRQRSWFSCILSRPGLERSTHRHSLRFPGSKKMFLKTCLKTLMKWKKC